MIVWCLCCSGGGEGLSLIAFLLIFNFAGSFSSWSLRENYTSGGETGDGLRFKILKRGRFGASKAGVIDSYGFVKYLEVLKFCLLKFAVEGCYGKLKLGRS